MQKSFYCLPFDSIYIVANTGEGGGEGGERGGGRAGVKGVEESGAWFSGDDTRGGTEELWIPIPTRAATFCPVSLISGHRLSV